MNKYQQMQKRHQDAVNALPIRYAFGQEQIDKVIKEFGCTKENYKQKLCSLFGAGDIVKRSDVPMIRKVFEDNTKELREAIMNDREFAVDAFVTELENHEYSVTGEVYDALLCLGFTTKEVCDNEYLNKVLCDAVTRINRWMKENGEA